MNVLGVRNIKNIGFIALSDLITKAVGLITLPYISRVLEPSGLGLYGIIIAIITFCGIIIQAGTNEYGILKTASIKTETNNSEFVAKILSLRSVMFVIVLLLFLFVFLTYIKFYSFNIYMISTLLLFTSLLSIEWVYISMEEMWVSSLFRIVIRVSYLILIFLFVNEPNDFNLVILFQGITEIIFIIMLWIYAFKSILNINALKISLGEIISTSRASSPLFLMTICVAAIGTIDVIILSIFSNPAEVGYYTAVLRIIVVATSIRSIMGQYFFPKFIKINEVGKQSAVNLYKILQKYFALVALIITVIVVLYSNFIIEIILGEQYENCNLLFSIVIWSIFIDFINFTAGYYVIINNRKYYSRIILFATLANILLNLIIVPFLGATGSAIAYIAFYLVLMISCHLYIQKQYKIHIVTRFILDLIFCAICLIVPYILVAQYSSYLSLIIGAIILVIYLYYSRTVKLQELRFILDH